MYPVSLFTRGRTEGRNDSEKRFSKKGGKEGNLGAYAMKLLAACGHLPTRLGFLSLRNAETVELTTAWSLCIANIYMHCKNYTTKRRCLYVSGRKGCKNELPVNT